MKPINILPLTVDLVIVFFNSARDALMRGKLANPEKVESGEVRGLYIFNKSDRLVQTILETVIASFLTVEAVINSCYFEEVRGKRWLSESDKFIKRKWGHGGISITEKLSLILGEYTMVEVDKIQPLFTLFKEFATFRNKIVHSRPDLYDALVEPSIMPDEIIVHAVDRINRTASFPTTQLSEELGRGGYQDAEKSYEIMLLILALLDSNFEIDLELSWYDQSSNQSAELRYGTVVETINQLNLRYFGHIDPNTFVIKKM